MRQLEAEADAIIQMVREGQRARRLQQAAPPTASAAVVVAAGSSVAAPHAPTGAAPPAGTAAAATVSMGRTDHKPSLTGTAENISLIIFSLTITVHLHWSCISFGLKSLDV